MKKMCRFLVLFICNVFLCSIIFINPQNVKAASAFNDGTYNIVSALNDNKVVDVSSAGKENSTNVQLWDCTDELQQQFFFSRIGNTNYYKIIDMNSQKALDVAGGECKSGVNVQIYDYNGSDAQLWELKSASNGYFYIKNKLGYYLDVSCSSTDNGTNIQVYSFNDTNAQKFKLRKTQSYTMINEGLYTIQSALNSNKVIDVSNAGTKNGTNVQLYDSNNTDAQKYYIEHVTCGYYKITNMNSKRVLDVYCGIKDKGVNVQIYDYNGSDAQLWRFCDAGNGFYYIMNKVGYCLDVCCASTDNGTNIQVYSLNNTNAQKFKFVPQTVKTSNTYDNKVSAFINNSNWKNGAYYGSSTKPKISPYKCSGCCAYAADFIKYVYGYDNFAQGSSFKNPNEIRTGDVIKVTGSQHWFVVLYRNGNNLTTAEGNWSNGKVCISDSAYTIKNNTLYRNNSVFRTFSVGYHFNMQ